MLYRAVLVAAVVGLAWGGPAEALFFNGNELQRICQAKNETASMDVCLGYINGVADVLSEKAEVAGSRACIPLGVTSSQAQAIVLRWLKEHPEDCHCNASSLVAEALEVAFPCK